MAAAVARQCEREALEQGLARGEALEAELEAKEAELEERLAAARVSTARIQNEVEQLRAEAQDWRAERASLFEGQSDASRRGERQRALAAELDEATATLAGEARRVGLQASQEQYELRKRSRELQAEALAARSRLSATDQPLSVVDDLRADVLRSRDVAEERQDEVDALKALVPQLRERQKEVAGTLSAARSQAAQSQQRREATAAARREAERRRAVAEAEKERLAQELGQAEAEYREALLGHAGLKDANARLQAEGLQRLVEAHLDEVDPDRQCVPPSAASSEKQAMARLRLAGLA